MYTHGQLLPIQIIMAVDEEEHDEQKKMRNT